MQIQIFVKFCYFLRLFFLFIVKKCDDMIKKRLEIFSPTAFLNFLKLILYSSFPISDGSFSVVCSNACSLAIF